LIKILKQQQFRRLELPTLCDVEIAVVSVFWSRTIKPFISLRRDHQKGNFLTISVCANWVSLN